MYADVTVVPLGAPRLLSIPHAMERLPSRALVGEALHCPFPRIWNPAIDHAQAWSRRWMERFFGDTPWVVRAKSARMAEMIASFYPSAPVERLLVASDYLCWAFALDDLGDETPSGQRPEMLAEHFARLDDVFAGRAVDARSHPAASALADILERLSKFATTEQLAAFHEANQAYWGAMLWEANNRAACMVPDEDIYRRLRPAAGAVPPFFALIEPIESIVIESHVRHSEAFVSLVQLAGGLVCWINDILSYEKESRGGEVHNLVTVLEVHRGLSRAAALCEAVKFCNAQMREFVQWSSSLPSCGSAQDEEMRRYSIVLQSMIRVTLDWTLHSTRYTGSSSVAGVPSEV